MKHSLVFIAFLLMLNLSNCVGQKDTTTTTNKVYESCCGVEPVEFTFGDAYMFVPNVFTPNNDGKNEFFGINTNLPVTVEYQLFNRWGNEMISGTKSNAISTSTNAYFTALWDGKDATEGVYFYKMKIKAVSEGKIWEENMEGFLELLR